jgi:hypothetical protein
MQRLSLGIVALALAVILAGGVTGRAMAQDQQAAATSIQLSVDPALDNRGHAIEGQYAVTATLTTADGQYVAGRPVEIVEIVSFFGTRSASLGAAVTDATGLAPVIYQPAQAGKHRIVARFAGDDAYAASTAETTIDAPSVVPPFRREPLPLAAVGTWLAVSLAILGIAFWVVLLGVLGRTAWRIKTAASAAETAALAGSALVLPTAANSRD